MIVLEQEDQELYDRVQEKNLIRQYDLRTNYIEVGLEQNHTAFDKYMLWALNHVARLIPLTQVRLYVVGAARGTGRRVCEDCLA